MSLSWGAAQCAASRRMGRNNQSSFEVRKSSRLRMTGSLWPQPRDDPTQSVGERGGCGLQNQGRLDLDDAAVADGRNLVPARPLSDSVWNDFLAAPRREDYIRRRGAHYLRRDDPVFRGLLKPQFWQDVFSARNLDQLGNPADATDQGIVPFLEIDFWLCRGPGDGCNPGETLLVAGCELIGALRRVDQRAQRADHRQNARDVALVEDMDVDPGADQIGDDVRLQVRESENQVRLELQDFWNVGRDKCRYPGLVPPSRRRPARV